MASLAEPLPEQDIATENPSRVVWALAWPAVALNSLQVINTLLDRGFIGHLPTSALTAHGGSMNVVFLMFSLAMALATGATALVARSFGANLISECRMASRQAVSLTAFAGVAMAAITAGIAAVASHMVLPKNDPDAIRLMTVFLLWYSAGMPAIYLIQTLAGCLRGIGDTKSPMVISGIQIMLHMTMNVFLIFPTREIHSTVFGHFVLPGAGLGLVGAAIALSTSAWVAAAIYLAFAGKTPLRALHRIRVPSPAWAARIFRIALPAALMAVLRVLSLTAFTLILAGVPNGSVAIAAMTVGFALESIMFMPSFGLAIAAGALVGQSLGMERPDRAERLGWIAAHHAALVTLALALPIYLAAPQIAAVLVGDKADVIREASTLLRFLCTTEVFFAYAMVTIGAMQGAGDTVRPMWITIIALWGVRVPLAFFASLPAGFKVLPWLALPFGLGLGAVGAWFSMAFTQMMQGVMAMWAFRQGSWKTKKV